jgi:hypothetical protein
MQKRSITGKTDGTAGRESARGGLGATLDVNKGKEPLTIADDDFLRVDERTRTADFLIHSQAL